MAVLLDELDFPGLGQPDPRVGHIVVSTAPVLDTSWYVQAPLIDVALGVQCALLAKQQCILLARVPRTCHTANVALALQVELKTANAVPLLRYSCSPRIIGLPTAQLNARRCAAPQFIRP